MQKIIHVLHISAARPKVFESIQKINGLACWWTTKVTGGENQGDVIDFTFIEGFNPGMLITACDEPELIRWECTGGHDLWQDNRFHFELTESERGTQLKFVQEYSKPISEEDYGTYNYNWAYYLESLKDYCETGQGKPYSA